MKEQSYMKIWITVRLNRALRIYLQFMKNCLKFSFFGESFNAS